jgi:hypothetical protein
LLTGAGRVDWRMKKGNLRIFDSELPVEAIAAARRPRADRRHQ